MKRDSAIDYCRLHDLAIEEVRACAAFAHLSDTEIQAVIETLKLFTKISYDFYEKTVMKSEKSD